MPEPAKELEYIYKKYPLSHQEDLIEQSQSSGVRFGIVTIYYYYYYTIISIKYLANQMQN